MNPHTKALRLAAEAVVTGSIVKVYSSLDSTAIATCTFGSFVDTGDFNLASSSITQTNGTSIPLTTGAYLEGPFCAIKMSNHAGAIVYYNGEIKVS